MRCGGRICAGLAWQALIVHMRRCTFLRASALVACVLACSACGGVGPAAPTPEPPKIIVRELATAVSAYNRQCPESDRLRAQTTIEYRSGKTKKSFDATIFLEISGRRLRLRADAYFVTLFDMVFYEEAFSVLVPSRNVLYRGNGESYRGFALQDLSEALRPTRLPVEEPGSVLVEQDRRMVTLTEITTNADGAVIPEQKVYLDRESLQLVRRNLYYPNGLVKCEILYGAPSDFGAGRFASRVVMNRPWQDISVTLNVEKLESPPAFKPDLFQILPPEGTTTVDVDPRMSEDILFVAD